MIELVHPQGPNLPPLAHPRARPGVPAQGCVGAAHASHRRVRRFRCALHLL